MKLILSSLFFLLAALSLQAQTDLEIVHNEKVLGKNLKTNTDIRGVEYIFPERIHRSYIDTATNQLTLHLRGLNRSEKYLDNTGKFILYDLASNTVKWSHKINYQMESIVQQEDVFIIASLNKSYCVSMENNQNKWEVRNRMYYIDPKQKVGIGFKSNLFSKNNILEGINLNTGEVLWTREFDAQFEWTGAFHQNDSVIIVVAKGLHAINLKTGKGWDYDAVTNISTFSAELWELKSNILVDSTSIYFASQTQIARLDKNGTVLWSKLLPKETGISTIYKNDSMLCMINKGNGIGPYRKVFAYGKPYIAKFDLKTGEQRFLTMLEGRKQQISEYHLDKDTALLIVKNKISKYSLKDGSLIMEKTIQMDSLKELSYFVGKLVYVKDGSTYKSLPAIDSTNYYLMTDFGKVLGLNHNLEITNQYDSKDIYIYYLKKNGYRFIAKENETFVLDKADQIVAELQVSNNGMIIGSKLYDVQKQNFVELDVSELIK